MRSTFRHVFCFAFTKLFKLITQQIRSVECDTVINEGLQLLHLILAIPNVCTTASLVDVVLPFYCDLAASQTVRPLMPSETLAGALSWCRFDTMPDEAVRKVSVCVDEVLESTVKLEGCRELQLRSCCMLLDALVLPCS